MYEFYTQLSIDTTFQKFSLDAKCLQRIISQSHVTLFPVLYGTLTYPPVPFPPDHYTQSPTLSPEVLIDTRPVVRHTHAHIPLAPLVYSV